MVTFDGAAWVAVARKWPMLPWATALVYVCGIVQLDLYMKNRKILPFKLRWTLITWNATLALLSAIGAAITLPRFLFGQPAGLFVTQNFVRSVCAPSKWYQDDSVGLVMMLFVHSKYLELIDTVLLVLRRKPLTLLHVLHHAATLLLCQRLYTTESSTGLVHGSINLFVHSLMYSYYGLSQFTQLRPWLLAQGHKITQLQLTQMALGVVVNLSILISVFFGNTLHCAIDVGSTACALTLYVVYFMLFAQFYELRKRKRLETSFEKRE